MKSRRRLSRPRRRGILSNLYTAGRVGYNAYKSLSNLRTKIKRSIEPPPVTGQHDYKTDYVRKRMPRRRRRRWLSFKKKVDYISDKKHGLKSWLVTQPEVFSSAQDKSNFFVEELFSIDGDGNHKDVGDIARAILGDTVFNNEYSVLGSSGSTTSKLISFESANIEVTVANTGSNGAILEVYHYRCRKDARQFSTVGYNNPGGYYVVGFNKLNEVTDPDTLNNPDPAVSDPLTFDTVGTTPFQCPLFCSHFQITKREKFTVPAGGSIQKSLRLPKNRSLNINSLRSLNCKRGWTEGFLFQFQGLPGTVSSTAVKALPTTLNVYTVKRYSYYLRAGGFDEGVLRYA